MCHLPILPQEIFVLYIGIGEDFAETLCTSVHESKQPGEGYSQ